jgi:hypothetical protein
VLKMRRVKLCLRSGIMNSKRHYGYPRPRRKDNKTYESPFFPY